MNLHNKTLSILSCMLLMFNLRGESQTPTPPPMQQSGSQAAVTYLDTLVDQARKQLDQIYALLTGLSGMISNNQIPTIHNKKDALNNIQQTNSLIRKIQMERFIHTDVTTAYFLLQLNEALMNHIYKTLKQDFCDFPPFDPTPICKRAPIESITAQKLEHLIELNKKRLEALTKRADVAGLKWYNLLYRKFDNYVVTPSRKYSIPKRTLTAAGLAATGTYLWWRFGDRSFAKYCPKPIQNLCGPRPIMQQGMVLNEDKLKALGKIESNFAQLGHGFLPIGGAISGFTIKALKKEWEYDIEPWLSKKLSIYTNKLKGGAYLKEAQRAAKLVDEVTFKDLVGLEHVKEEFSRLVHYLINPESHDRMNVTPPKGILLVGATRTGKSHSVKALFGEIGNMLKAHGRNDEFKFIEFSATDINKHGIDDLLRLVKKCAPCVVFIDEIDLLDLQRKGKNQMLSDFLTCMSGTVDSHDPKNQVIIIAATNRPENLDIALRQPGRFGKEIRFEYPSFKERKEFITRQMNKLSLSLDMFNINKLARETESQSYEALKVLINSAVLKARVHGEIVTQKHIEETLDEELRHVTHIDTTSMSPYEKQIIAVHVAGQALALMHLDMHTKLSKVTIRPVMKDIKEEAMGMHLYSSNKDKAKDEEKQKRFEYGSVFTYHDFDSVNMYTREEKIKMCQYHLAGVVAEELLIPGDCGFSCHNDDTQKALSLMETLTFQGLDKYGLPKRACNERSEQALELVNQCKEQVKALLEEHLEELLLLAQALHHIDTLNMDEINLLFKAHAELKAQGALDDPASAIEKFAEEHVAAK